MYRTFIKIIFFLILLTFFSAFNACSNGKEKTTETVANNQPTQDAAKKGERKIKYWKAPMDPTEIYDHPGKSKMGMDLVPVYEDQVSSRGTVTTDPSKKGERKIKYWQAPMNPTEIYDHPGKSKMGMDLVPVYEDQVSSGGTVTIDPTTEQNMGVRTAVVQKTTFNRTLRAQGHIQYNEEKIYVVSPKISGWIEKLYVDYTGKEVKKGQPLLEIYSPDLVTTQQEYLLALKNKQMIKDSKFASIRESAETLLESSRQRLLYWDIPQTEITRLESSGKVRKTLTLDSPANGIVLHKNAFNGMAIKQGMDLYKIADLSTVWVIASIYDNEVPWIKVGQKAEMELPYDPGKKLEGRISYIYPYLNDKSRTVQVRLEFPNPGLQLKPDMYSDVYIDAPPVNDAIVVPAEAVIRTGERNVVFVTRGGGRFEPRQVTIGEEGNNGSLQIKSGLLPGENVVTSAQFMLDSESRLQEAIQKMLDEKSAPKPSQMEGMDKKEMSSGATGDSNKKMNMSGKGQ